MAKYQRKSKKNKKLSKTKIGGGHSKSKKKFRKLSKTKIGGGHSKSKKKFRKLSKTKIGGGNSKSIDGFSNEERLSLNQKVLNYYLKLFRKKSVPYPLNDPRAFIPLKDLLKMNMNKDGSLKKSFIKTIKTIQNCKKKTLYKCFL